MSSPPQTEPLDAWRGRFGTEYAARNVGDEREIADVEIGYRRILAQSDVSPSTIGSVLEVGANIGFKLAAMRRILGPEAHLSALEPNADACQALRNDAGLAVGEVFETDASAIPAVDRSYDLVYTNVVLIHVRPDRLKRTLEEIVRVSRRYVLLVEYFSHTPMEVEYRGQQGLLWKRDFGAALLDVAPQLTCRAYGFLWERDLPTFDNQNWWLFEKPERLSS